MSTFGGNAITSNPSSDIRRSHLAVVQGTGPAAEASNVDPASRMRAAAQGSTGYGAAEPVARSRHEEGVRAVAKRYDNFADALLPMVLASGVSGESAVAVAEAIKANPALTAQAERAFQRARINVL